MPLQPTSDQGGTDPTDIVVAAAAAADSGLISGCNVLASAPPSMTLTVASGTLLVGGTQTSVAQTTVTLPGAQNVDRYDLLVVDSTGTPSVVMGSAVAPPQEPAVPSGVVVLASVRVPAGSLGITPDLINDKRVAVGPKNKPNVTGSRGSNAALASLLTALANLNLITDSTTA